MYATPHTLAAFVILDNYKDDLATGIPLAIASHFVLDFINESGLTTKDRTIFDIIPSVISFAVSIFTGHFLFLLLKAVCGNLLDLIDKKMYLSIFFPTKFKSTKYFHFQKPLIHPKPIFTKFIGIASCLFMCYRMIFF